VIEPELQYRLQSSRARSYVNSLLQANELFSVVLEVRRHLLVPGGPEGAVGARGCRGGQRVPMGSPESKAAILRK
jgi:hypothetical protein